MARIPVNGGFSNIEPWWNEDDRKHDNHNLRFKFVFPDDEKGKESFMSLWPLQLEAVASDSWDLFQMLFPDLFLNAKTILKCKGLVKRGVLKYQGQFKRLTEINNIALSEWFSNDITKEINRSASSHTNSQGKASQNESSNGTQSQFDNNNNAQKDAMGNVINWTDSKYAVGTDTNNATTNSDSNQSNDSWQEGNGNEINKSSSTKYNGKDALILLSMSEDPSSRLFGKLVHYIAAPAQESAESLHDWRGDYKGELD